MADRPISEISRYCYKCRKVNPIYDNCFQALLQYLNKLRPDFGGKRVSLLFPG